MHQLDQGPQLVGSVLSMGLATLTCVLPITLLLLFLCLIAGIVAAAKLLHWTHGLAPGPFSAGFYLATLLLVGAGGWQLVESVRVFLAQRSAKTQPTDEAFPEPAPKADSHRLRSVVMHQPWMLLGTLRRSTSLFLAFGFQRRS